MKKAILSVVLMTPYDRQGTGTPLIRSVPAPFLILRTICPKRGGAKARG